MKKFSDLWGQATEAAELYIHLICLCKNEANCEGRNIKKCWGMVALHYHYSHLHTRHFMMPPDIFWCILTPPLFQSLQKEVRFRQPRYASHNRIFMRKKNTELRNWISILLLRSSTFTTWNYALAFIGCWERGKKVHLSRMQGVFQGFENIIKAVKM